MALSTTQLRAVWGPACHITSTRVVLFGGAPITVDYRTKEAFNALSACLEAHQYPADRNTTGAYNCRAITGGTGYSLHAFGIAVDINWARNPYQKPAQYARGLTTDMPPAMVSDILGITTRSGALVFRWGGNYSGNKDPMHYEVVCTPADLASGIIGHDPIPAKPDPSRPTATPTGAPTAMAFSWTHPSDSRQERIWINPATNKLETRWQTNAGGHFGPYGEVATGTPNLQFEPGSLAAHLGPDGNLNWSARLLGGGQANEFYGWYQEQGYAGHPLPPGVTAGWKGPFDMDG